MKDFKEMDIVVFNNPIDFENSRERSAKMDRVFNEFFEEQFSDRTEFNSMINDYLRRYDLHLVDIIDECSTEYVEDCSKEECFALFEAMEEDEAIEEYDRQLQKESMDYDSYYESESDSEEYDDGYVREEEEGTF